MKPTLLLLLILSLVSNVRSQEATPPAGPSGAMPSGLPDLPGLAELQGLAAAPEVVDSNPPSASPEGGATNVPAQPSVSGATTPENGAVPSVAGPPDQAPTDPSGTPPAGDVGKLDFLQRSNLILAKILDSDRAVDPFGMIMDPANAKETPILADQYAEVEETPVLNNSSLKTALLGLPITGVYPQRDQIVLGARSFAVGDQFGMRLQDLTIRLRFEGVRGQEVYFKDMETREVTSIPFNARPAEFEPLRRGEKRPAGDGIIPMGDLFIVN